MAETLRELRLETPLLMRLLPDGHCLAQSIARAEFVAFGSEASVVAEHRAFLSRHLLEVRADEVAGFELPAALKLDEVAVEIARLDLPRPLRHTISIEIPVITAPRGNDSWCIAPSLGHTFFVSRAQNRREAIATELARVVAAADPADLDVRRLLPADDTWIETLSVDMVVGEGGLLGSAHALRRKEIDRLRKEAAVETLRSAGRVVTAEHSRARLLFRDAELRQLGSRLGASARGSVAIVGGEAVGKSALMQAWLGTNDERLLVATSVAQLIAGASGFGEWQERVATVLAAAELLDAVLYFENLGEIFAERRQSGGVDIAGALRRFVLEERVRVVGELKADAFERARKTHAGLLSAVTAIRLEPLSAAQTEKIVLDRITAWRRQDPSSVAIEPQVAAPIVRLTERYQPYREFPGKALRFLAELRASRAVQRDADGVAKPIGAEDAFTAFGQMTGIPSFLLRQSEPLRLEKLLDSFRRHMIGQEQAVRLVAETICTVKAEMQPVAKPLSTFLFVGPTGVGKTELARTLAFVLFGSSERLVRFDMSEFTDAYAGDRLIRGVDGQAGLLTSRVRETPFCVLLLDEIEKAHPAIHDLLLQVCGSGRLTDGRGRTTVFENAIIIMTSNLGSSHQRKSSGLGSEAGTDSSRDVLSALADAFRPEMLGRIDRVVPFSPLTQSEVTDIAALAIDKIGSRRGLAEAGISLSVTDLALQTLAKGGYSETYGVRALRRHLENRLVTPIAHQLSAMGLEARSANVVVRLADELPAQAHGNAHVETIANADDGITIELYRRAAASSRVAMRGLSQIAARRREGDALVALDEVEAIRERLSQLRAQLATINRPKRSSRGTTRTAARSAQIASLQTEHHRLAGAHDGVVAAQHDLHASEELAIGALLAGLEAREWADETAALVGALRRAMFWLLTCERSQRSSCFLRFASVGHPEPASEWLIGLLDSCHRRGDQVRLYTPRTPTSDNPSRWSKPQDKATFRALAANQPQTLRPAVVHIQGKDAGVLYPIEAGLHRYDGYSSNGDPAYLIVDLAGLGSSLADDVWDSEMMTARPPTTIARNATAVRNLDKGGNSVVVADEIVSIANGYFPALEEIGLAHLLSLRGENSGIEAAYTTLADSLPLEGGDAGP